MKIIQYKMQGTMVNDNGDILHDWFSNKPVKINWLDIGEPNFKKKGVINPVIVEIIEFKDPLQSKLKELEERIKILETK